MSMDQEGNIGKVLKLILNIMDEFPRGDASQSFYPGGVNALNDAVEKISEIFIHCSLAYGARKNPTAEETKDYLEAMKIYGSKESEYMDTKAKSLTKMLGDMSFTVSDLDEDSDDKDRKKH